MIRKINFTGRKRIKRGNVRVDILQGPGAQRVFTILMDLSDLGLDPEARVFVEAYHRTGYQRFDFGSIGRRQIPEDRRLVRFSDAIVPLFRVKVVDRRSMHGRILAVLDKIRPESVEDEPSGSEALLFVEYDDLGERIWLLDMDGDWPVLRLNRKVEEISLVAGTDAEFFALVYPEVFRQVLTRVLIEEEHADPDCDDDWPSLWLKLARGLPGVGEPPDAKGEHAAWIEAATEAFAARHDLLRKFNLSIQGRR